MTAVVSYGGLRVEFAGTAEFVAGSVRKVMCDGVPLVDYIGHAMRGGSERLLLSGGESIGMRSGSVDWCGVDVDGCQRFGSSERVVSGTGFVPAEQVGVVGRAAVLGKVGDTRSDCVEKGEGTELSGSESKSGASLFGPNWERNCERRRKKKENKKRKHTERFVVGSGSKVEERGVNGEAGFEAVPEWRRKDVRATYHKGAFADCSEVVQRKLRDSRALMLVAKNEAAVVEAEHRRRTVEARLKSRMVEEEVEKKRLVLAAENQKLLEAKLAKLPAGYAKTLCSMGLESIVGTPSLSSGSVSPDSSISVAELKRKEAALELMTVRIAELELKLSRQKQVVVKKPAVESVSLYSRWD